MRIGRRPRARAEADRRRPLDVAHLVSPSGPVPRRGRGVCPGGESVLSVGQGMTPPYLDPESQEALYEVDVGIAEAKGDPQRERPADPH